MVKRYGSRYKRRRTYGRRYGRSRRLGRRVKRVERSVKRVSRLIETKEYSSGLIATSVADVIVGPTILYMNTLQQGTDIYQRVGNQITITSVTYDWLFTISSGLDHTNVVRAMLIWDKMWNSSSVTPTLDTYLEWTSTPYRTITPQSVYNWSNRKRYRILVDKQMHFAEYDTQQRRLSGTKKVNRKTTYSAGTSNISAIQSGLMFWVFVSDSQVGPHPTVQGTFRVKYKDA